MRPLPITAMSLVSAMGRGTVETVEALRTGRSGLTPCDFGGVTRGYVGRVIGVEDIELPQSLARYTCRNNQLAEWALRLDGFTEAVRTARDRHGADRIATIIGTSTSGILAGEEAYLDRNTVTGELPDDFDHAGTHDMFSASRFVGERLELTGPALAVSTACASSAKVFADAHQMIEAGLCDAAVVGGVDTLCRLTLRGFEALQLVAEGPCRPGSAQRDGVSIGEAAGFVLLERDRPEAGRPRLALLGYGSSSDGYHMSSPDPTGAGAVLAMQGALDRAGLTPDDVDYVNLHGTGTLANDAMEDIAVSTVFGDSITCSSTKGLSGHTLGAAGIVGAIVSLLAIQEGMLPGAAGVEEPDPSFRCGVLTGTIARPVRRVVSNSFGFGGVNCSLALGLEE